MRLLIIFHVMLISMAPAFAQCDTGEIVTRLGIPTGPEASIRIRFSKSLAAAVNGALQGKACVEVIVSTPLYGEDKSLAAVKSGAVHMAIVPIKILTNTSSRMIVFSLPFAFRDDIALDRFISEPVYADMLNSISSTGIIPIGQLHRAFVQIAGIRPIHGPGDVAGMRMRRSDVPDPTSRPALLGASARDINDAELAKALKAKQIEAVTGSWKYLASNDIDRTLDGATQTNHRYDGYMVLVSADWWKLLDEAVKTRFQQLVSATVVSTNSATMAQEKAAMDTIINRGSPVRGLTDKQRQMWLDKLQPMWSSIQSDGKLLSAIRRANAMP